MKATNNKRTPCPRCQNDGGLRRISRAGFFERVILYQFGILPWECAFCRRKSYHRRAAAEKLNATA